MVKVRAKKKPSGLSRRVLIFGSLSIRYGMASLATTTTTDTTSTTTVRDSWFTTEDGWAKQRFIMAIFTGCDLQVDNLIVTLSDVAVTGQVQFFWC